MNYGYGLFQVSFTIWVDPSTLELLKSLSGTISRNLHIMLEQDRKLFEQMIYNFEALPTDIDKLFFFGFSLWKPSGIGSFSFFT